jgi:hypothetical protein
MVRSLILLGLLVVGASGLGATPAEIANDLEYTLVQFIDDTTCTAKRYVCQPVTLGQTRIFYTHERHGNDKVCSKLIENKTDATFRVDSCLAAGPECPKECGCYEMMPKLVLDKCYGDTMKGHGKTSTMLVKGEMPGCVMSGTSHKMDIDMARFCNQWPSQPDGHYTKMAEDRGVAEKKAALMSNARFRQRRHLHPQMSAGDSDLPEQGFSGKEVDHVNQETFTGDWGTEYGPGTGHPNPTPVKSAGSVSALPLLRPLLIGFAALAGPALHA